VLPGPKLDGESVYQLLEDERVTMTAGVPTVWMMLLNYMQQHGKRFSTLKRVIVGGSAAPEAMIRTFQDQYGVELRHAWGMTETSPLGSFCSLTPAMKQWPKDEQVAVQRKQGRPAFGVELRIVDDAGVVLPETGEVSGDLQIRGPWVCSGYYEQSGESPTHHPEGWFSTGDVATLDPAGFMQITDRSKDVIKSGGEWISSITLENLAMGHPAVAEAAVIGVAHPRWLERPLLVVVLRQSAELEPTDLIDHVAAQVPRWWRPDAVVFVDALPHTATGKVSKLLLRQQLKDYKLPDEPGDAS
jgi:fatty-acyl-CoA synthase